MIIATFIKPQFLIVYIFPPVYFHNELYVKCMLTVCVSALGKVVFQVVYTSFHCTSKTYRINCMVVSCFIAYVLTAHSSDCLLFKVTRCVVG